MSGTEIELKLLVPARDLARIFQSGPVTRRAAGQARRSLLTGIYYDTPECDLRSRGVALRLRRENGQWVQALKGEGRIAGGLHQREELEWPVPGRRIDPALLAQSRHSDLFARRRVADSLQPVFTTRFSRTAQSLRFDDGTLVQLCADRGSIRAGTRQAPISELEIELKSGDPIRLYDLAQELVDLLPLRPGDLSKAERGYALLFPEPARPRKALAAALDRDTPAIVALERIAGACMAQIQANEDGFLTSGDPEYLHQLRVGFRRLRVALSLPQEPAWREALAPLKAELQWLFSVLGPARNWDVYVTETLAPLAAHAAGAVDLMAWKARCRRLRARQLEAAREAVRSPRYARLLLALGALLRRPAWAEGAGPLAAQFANIALERHDRRVRRTGGGLALASAEERHRTRIQAKKLRYCAEFFASLYPKKKVKRYVAALSRLQDVLGALNDAGIGASMTVNAAKGWRRGDAQVIGMVQGWIAANEAHLLESLERAWGEFAKQDSYWGR